MSVALVIVLASIRNRVFERGSSRFESTSPETGRNTGSIISKLDTFWFISCFGYNTQIHQEHDANIAHEICIKGILNICDPRGTLPSRITTGKTRDSEVCGPRRICVGCRTALMRLDEARN